MDRPERAQVAGEASRHQGMPGATPEPEQAVFRGRQVAEGAEAGPSPSRTEPQATGAIYGVGTSPRVSVIRRVGRAGSGFQPYSAGKPGQRPGASLLPAGEPSARPVPQAGGTEPEPPARFHWVTVYHGILERRGIDAARGDTYAVAAFDSALGAIGRAVRGAYSAHLANAPNSEPPGTQDALQTLRNVLANAKSRRHRHRAVAVQQAVDDIYHLTHARNTELRHRSDDFQSVSLPRAVPVPGREALGRWLQARADEANGNGIVNSYFTQLAKALPQGRDPWTVSRELMASLPSPGDQNHSAQLKAAHIRVVQAIACRLSEQCSGSGDPEPSRGFNWHTAFAAIRNRQARDTRGRDIYAAAASAAALLDIDQAMRYAYFTHRLQQSYLPPCGPAEILNKIRTLRKYAKDSGNPARAETIQRSLDYMNRIAHARNTELKRRSYEFQSASHPPGAPVPDPEALARWLQSQADAAPGTGIEHSYFKHLKQQLAGGRDPWTVSRELVRSLPSPDSAQQASRLRAAHHLVVQAMAAGGPQPAAVPPPGVAQASGQSLAPVSMQQDMVGRLNSRNPLSDWQVQVLRSAVGRAIDAGTIDAGTYSVSASQLEDWARDLVPRVQASVRRPFDDLTESERAQQSSDLQSLGKLIEEIGSLGYL